MEPTNQGEAPKLSQMLREHHHELWIGDAAEIRAVMVRKQKTTRAMPYIFWTCY
jgi:hypothetical protein